MACVSAVAGEGMGGICRLDSASGRILQANILKQKVTTCFLGLLQQKACDGMLDVAAVSTTGLSTSASLPHFLSPRFAHRAALVLCEGNAEVSLPRPGVSRRSSSPSRPTVCPQPALQAGSRGRCPLGYG
jgi:hypothetical protein